MLFVQSGLLLWWITNNDVAPGDPICSGALDTKPAKGDKVVEPETSAGETSVNENLTTGQRFTTPKVDAQASTNPSDALSLREKIRPAYSPTKPSVKGAQHQERPIGTQTNKEKKKETSTPGKGLIQQPETPLERRSILSGSSEGTLPDDAESVYSSSSHYETDTSTASLSPERLQIVKPYPPSSPARPKLPTEKMSSPSREDPNRASVTNNKATKGVPSAKDIDDEETAAHESTQHTSKLPPRTSRILAQLDDLLVTEMGTISPQSPLAKSATKSKSDGLHLDTPLEVRRLVLEADQRRQQEKKSAGGTSSGATGVNKGAVAGKGVSQATKVADTAHTLSIAERRRSRRRLTNNWKTYWTQG